MKLSLKEHGAILTIALTCTALIQLIWPSPSALWVTLHYTVGVSSAYGGYALGSRRAKKGGQ